MTESVLPEGFRTSGTTCGIKDSGRSDLALFVSDCPAVTTGVFTANRVVGAPVKLNRSRVPSDSIRAVVINSGNANACTGEQGDADARQMTAEIAALLNCEPSDVLVCSTGIIGVPLPMDKISSGLSPAVDALENSSDAFRRAAQAMMTTDTFPKLFSVDVALSSGTVRISGAAKGAAMIAPNMATMLSVLMTDAVIDQAVCDRCLRHAVNHSFNCISVDGHMSTSDTVLLLAGGVSGIAVTDAADVEAFEAAVRQVSEKLATDIIRDAEGADHFVTVDVCGFDSRESAFAVAKEVAESALVKTAIAGNDPNWGRITSAAGYAGVDFDMNQLSLKINDTEVFSAGTPASYDEAALSEQMSAQPEVHLTLRLSGGPCAGEAAVRFWTSDLTQEYVRLNSEYTT